MKYSSKNKSLLGIYLVSMLLFFQFLSCKDESFEDPIEISETENLGESLLSDIPFSFRPTTALEPKESATVYYVAPDGDDANTGLSYDTPFKTFEAAINLLQPGDFIYALGGTYNEDNAGRNYKNDILPLIRLEAGDPSGTASDPIVIKNYPGEMPILDMKGVNAQSGGNPVTVAINAVHHIYIEGFEIINGMFLVRGGNGTSSTHDIYIQNNHIHDFTAHGGSNPGLIKIDRGDFGTPAENIYVRNNRLHDLYDTDEPGVAMPIDFQHFGAVTILSACTYMGYAGGCTQDVFIQDNYIYNIPQAFFFKNPMEGPILIENNFITDTRGLGGSYASNVTLTNNLIVDVVHGFNGMGDQEGNFITEPGVIAASGHNYTIENNTFIGLQSLLSIKNGSHHIIRNNVFFGMSSAKDQTNWNTPAFLLRQGNYGSVAANDHQSSNLTTITSTDNCFISSIPASQLLHTKRRPPTGAEVTYSVAEAQQTFGFDTNSIFITERDQNAMFVNPSENNFSLINCEQCACKGYQPY